MAAAPPREMIGAGAAGYGATHGVDSTLSDSLLQTVDA